MAGRLVDALEERGFYAFADASRVFALKTEASRAGFLFAEETRRSYPVDSEDLAEGGAQLFLTVISPLLERLGVELRGVRQELSERGYSVTVNGMTFTIYNDSEVRSDEIWQVSCERVLGLVNRLLVDAGARERAYLVNGGVDLRAVFLTPAMASLLRANGACEAGAAPTRVAPIRPTGAASGKNGVRR